MNTNNWRYSFMKVLSLFFVIISSCSLALSLSGVPVARAATFTISDGDVYGPNGLVAAINSANSNGQANTINLAKNGFYMLNVEVDNSHNSGLPAISSDLTINGNGASVQRDPTFTIPRFRVLYITGTGNLKLNNLRIGRGEPSGNGLKGSDGAGAYNDNGTLSINDSTFYGNYANGGSGAGIFNAANNGNSASLTVTNSTFSSNSASGSGGGIENQAVGAGIAQVKVVNSTFSGNSGTFYGGGIYNDSFFNSTANLTVINSTFAYNGVFSGGNGSGAVGNSDNGGTKTFTLQNTLLANNINGNCGGTFSNAGTNNLEYPAPNPLFSTCGAGSTIAASDPLASNLLQYNGGPNQTYTLAANSAALDAGNATICADATTVNNKDQRGAVRPQGGACDIGAVENLVCSPTLVVTSALDDVTCGTLRVVTAAATSGSTITFSLAIPATINLIGGGIIVPANVNIQGSCSANKPDITINGTGLPSEGLILRGNTLTGLNIHGFRNSQVYAINTHKNHFKCVELART